MEEVKLQGKANGGHGARDQFPVGMRVLAVDDDPTCLKVLENLLLRCQYHGMPNSCLLLLLCFSLSSLYVWIPTPLIGSFLQCRFCFLYDLALCLIWFSLFA